MAFLIPTVGDRRGDSPLPQYPSSPYSTGPYGQSLSGGSMYRDNDRYAMGLVGQPLEGNSLEQYLRSMYNWGGSMGQNQYQQGGAAVGNALDYYSNILNARNPGTLVQAMQPEINSTNAMYNNASRQLSTYAPMGGGRASLMQQLPYQRTQQISNLISQARPMAAQAVGQLGTSQQQNAGNLLSMIVGNMLQGRGQDVSEHGQSMSLAGQLGSSMLGGFSQGFGQGYGSRFGG